MSDEFFLRCGEPPGELRLNVQGMLEAYIGLEIRIAITSLEAARQTSERLGLASADVEGVTLDDLTRAPKPGDA